MTISTRASGRGTTHTTITHPAGREDFGRRRWVSDDGAVSSARFGSGSRRGRATQMAGGVV
ncbi:MAG: hypothetical protein ACRDQZ_24625, partial [Mycobacteriales bacterium]